LEKRAENLAIAATLQAVFSPFGFLIGGYLGDISTRLTFQMQIVGLLFLGILYFLILKDKEDESTATLHDFIKDVNPFKVIGDAKGIMTKYLMAFFVICAATNFASTCYEQCFNYFILDQYGFPPSYNGLLKAGVGFVALIANTTICLWLLKKTNIKKSLIPVLSVCLMMMIAIVLVQEKTIFIVINVIFFGFNAIYLPLLQAILVQVSKKDNGVLVGLFNSMRSLGMILGSLFAGFIYALGPRLSFVSSAFAFAIAIVAALIYYRLS